MRGMLYNIFAKFKSIGCVPSVTVFLETNNGDNKVKYQSKTAIAYMFRNFWRLAPISLVAAVLLGYFCNTNAEIAFVNGYLNGTVNSENILTSVLYTVSVLRFGKYWWGALIAFVVFAFTESVLSVKVSNHMRTGEMLSFPLKRSFSVFPTMLLFVFCIVLIEELMNLIVGGIIFLIRALGEVTMVALTLVLAFFVRVLALYLVGTLIYAFPIMFLEQYSFNQALSYSVRISGDKRKTLRLVSVFYPLAKLVFTVCAALIDVPAVTVALFSLFYLFSLLLLPSVAFAFYYDSVGGERQDIGNKIF